MHKFTAALPFSLLVTTFLTLPPASADAARFQLLHSFVGGEDGGISNAPLIRDSRGNLFGTALNGGTTNNGVVFEITAKGDESVLYSFAGGNDGRRPAAGLLVDKSGNLFGTTTQGGPVDVGTVFRLAPDGIETVLHAFAGGASDGDTPQANLIADDTGDLFGTTAEGGTADHGTIFELAADGSTRVLYSFSGGSDGALPIAGLIKDSKGNLYGTAESGGNGFGTVFRLSRQGKFTVLHTFTGGSDGVFPAAGLISDAAGNLYGTTRGGGNFTACPGDGCGTIFKLSPDGSETILHAFNGRKEGSDPFGSMVADSLGNFYGTDAGSDTSHNLGVVFEFRTDGTFKSLHRFAGARDGALPLAGVILDAKGNVYGTASAEGPDGFGTVFEVKR